MLLLFLPLPFLRRSGRDLRVLAALEPLHNAAERWAHLGHGLPALANQGTQRVRDGWANLGAFMLLRDRDHYLDHGHVHVRLGPL